jgi:outer membrane protein TolC
MLKINFFQMRDHRAPYRFQWLCFLMVIAVAFAHVSTNAHAQQGPAPAVAMTLAKMSEELATNNPQLQQAQQAYNASRAQVKIVTTLPNPTAFIYETPIANNPLRLGASQGFSYSIGQPFLFPGKQRLAGESASHQADYTKTQMDSLLLQLLSQLKSNFYQLQLLRLQQSIIRETLIRFDQLKQLARARYSVNAAGYVDFLNAQVAYSSAENDLFAIQRNIDTARATMNTLMGRDANTPLEVVDRPYEPKMPAATLTQLEELAVKTQPLLNGAGSLIRSGEANVNLAKLAYYPDFNLVMSFISDNPPFGVGQGNQYGVELDLILPTWFFTREKAAQDQANANLIAARASFDALRQQILLQLSSSYNSLAQSVNQFEFLQTRQLPQAQAAYRLAIANYANNAAAFVDVQNAALNLRTTESNIAQARVAVAQAHAGLVATVGKEID